MKRKQGLSMDEKCARVEAFLAESRQPFTLKELEVAMPKRGVIFQSVQECLETLASERRADTDKVGISVLFWNFYDGTEGDGGAGAAIPKGIDGKKVRIELLKNKKQNLEQKLREVEKGIAAATDTPAQAQHRTELSTSISLLRAQKLALEKEVKERSAALAISPSRLKKQYELQVQLVNAWTNNLMLLEDKAMHVRGGGSRAELRRQVGIDVDMDFV